MSDMPQPGPPVFHTCGNPLPDKYIAGTHLADIVMREVLSALGVPHDTSWQQALEMIRMLARDTTYSERWASQLLDARLAGRTEVMREVKSAMGWQGEWEAVLDELRKRAF